MASFTVKYWSRVLVLKFLIFVSFLYRFTIFKILLSRTIDFVFHGKEWWISFVGSFLVILIEAKCFKVALRAADFPYADSFGLARWSGVVVFSSSLDAAVYGSKVLKKSSTPFSLHRLTSLFINFILKRFFRSLKICNPIPLFPWRRRCASKIELEAYCC